MRKLYLFLFLAALSVSCSKDKEAEPAIVLSDSDLKLHYDDTHQFALTKGTEAVSATTFKWTSSDTIVGKVDQNGKFTGRRIGQTTIKAASTDGKTTLQSKVTIDPYSTLCVEPVTDFKANQAAVKAKEKRTVLQEDTATIVYKPENAKLRGVAYGFRKNALIQSALIFTESKAVLDEAALFLAERYEELGEEDGFYFYTDNKVVVVVTDDETIGFVALYNPYPVGGLRTSVPFIQTMKESAKIQLQSIKANFKGF